MTLVCFDIDGTLAKIDHRLGFVRSKPKNWKAFNAGIPGDQVNEAVRTVYRHFALSPFGDATVVIASGRSEEVRESTEEWLRRNDIIQYDKLYMRKDRDFRSDDIIKEEILKEIITDYGKKPDMVFDDRRRVVNMWRANGIWVFDCNQSGEDF